jgi:hypothetical protein
MRILTFPAAALALTLARGTTVAGEVDGCAHFSWDVSHELAVLKQAPQALTAAVKPDGAAAAQIERLYELKLAPQESVTYAAAAGKAGADEGAHGGRVHFSVPSAGVYRISLTTRHWIDVVADGQIIKSRDFQGARGCDRPHKIVEFELPAGRQLTLQFSGAAAPSVQVAITAVAAPATR